MSDADGYWIWLDNVDQRSGRVNHKITSQLS